MKLRLPAGYHHTTNPSPNTLHIRKVLPCFGSHIEIVSDKNNTDREYSVVVVYNLAYC